MQLNQENTLSIYIRSYHTHQHFLTSTKTYITSKYQADIEYFRTHFNSKGIAKLYVKHIRKFNGMAKSMQKVSFRECRDWKKIIASTYCSTGKFKNSCILNDLNISNNGKKIFFSIDCMDVWYHFPVIFSTTVWSNHQMQCVRCGDTFF